MPEKFTNKTTELHALRCAAVQAEKLHDFITTNKRNQTCFPCLEVLQEGKCIEKICSVESSQHLLEVLPIGFTLKRTAELW